MEAESLQYAVAGQTGELRCTAQSSPPPSINWYRDESDTSLLQQFGSTASDFGVYRISNVQTDDAGLYKCRGSYSFGSEEKEIQLLVLSKLYKYTSMWFTVALVIFLFGISRGTFSCLWLIETKLYIVFVFVVKSRFIPLSENSTMKVKGKRVCIQTMAPHIQLPNTHSNKL